jgi:hypothetical protein
MGGDGVESSRCGGGIGDEGDDGVGGEAGEIAVGSDVRAGVGWGPDGGVGGAEEEGAGETGGGRKVTDAGVVAGEGGA